MGKAQRAHRQNCKVTCCVTSPRDFITVWYEPCRWHGLPHPEPKASGIPAHGSTMGGMCAHNRLSPIRGEAEYLPSRRGGGRGAATGDGGIHQHTTSLLTVTQPPSHPPAAAFPRCAREGILASPRHGTCDALHSHSFQPKPRTGHHTYQPVGNPRAGNERPPTRVPTPIRRQHT